MTKLMKYEARKSIFAVLMLFLVTGICQCLFLYGIWFTNTKKSSALGLGIVSLVISGVAGISFIGIQSLLTLYRDLNTKQSYMLFMTPRSGYQILGAKIVENALSILIVGGFYAILAYIDLSMVMVKFGKITDVLKVLQDFFSLGPDLDQIGKMILMGFFEVLFSWILMVAIGYLAITVSSSVLSGQKFNAVVSFILFVVINAVLDKIILSISDMLPAKTSDVAVFLVTVAAELLMSTVMYLITGYLMEKKLSV